MVELPKWFKGFAWTVFSCNLIIGIADLDYLSLLMAGAILLILKELYQ